METKKLIYNAENNLSNENNNRHLHEILFYPKAEQLTDYIAEAIKHKNADFRFFGKNEVWSAVNNIVRNCYDKSKDDGVIHIDYLYNAVAEVAELVDNINFWKNLNNRNKIYYENRGINFFDSSTDMENLFIGVATLEEDYKDGDSDCYETAGGYRSFIAPKGTNVEIRLNKNLSVRCSFDSHCLIDHYNNNICGTPTGNGTTKYELGERVEKRGVNMGREFIDKTWNKRKAMVDVKSIDSNRVLQLIRLWHPKLSEALL